MMDEDAVLKELALAALVLATMMLIWIFFIGLPMLGNAGKAIGL